MGIIKTGKRFFLTGWIAGFTEDKRFVKQDLSLELIERETYKKLIKGGDTSKKALMTFLPGFTGIAIYAKIQDAWTGKLVKEIRFVISEFVDEFSDFLTPLLN